MTSKSKKNNSKLNNNKANNKNNSEDKKNVLKMRRIEDWQEVRKQGKWKFIRSYGIFGWGLQTFILFWLIFNLLEHRLNFSAWFPERWIFIYSSWLLIFMIGGGLWGLVMWIYSERKYSKK